jgi:hypothetical protein
MKQLPSYLDAMLELCAQDNRERDILRRPFIRNGRLVLTNGRVLVTLPGGDWDIPPPKSATPDIERTLSMVSFSGRFVAPDSISVERKIGACSLCAGSGFIRLCPFCSHGCGNSGCQSCHFKEVVPCSQKAKGATPCDACHGSLTEHFFKPEAVTIHGERVRGDVWHAISSLPDFMVKAPLGQARRPKNHVRPFTFSDPDGGRGVFTVMREV